MQKGAFLGRIRRLMRPGGCPISLQNCRRERNPSGFVCIRRHGQRDRLRLCRKDFSAAAFPKGISPPGCTETFFLPFLRVSAISRMNMHSMHIYASLFSQVLWLLRFHAQHLGIKVINSPIGLCKASDRLYPLIFRCFRAMIGAFGNLSVPSSGLSTA